MTDASAPVATQPISALAVPARAEVVAAFNYSNRLANAIALQPDPQFVSAHRNYGA